jgi:hypothetical protein
MFDQFSQFHLILLNLFDLITLQFIHALDKDLENLKYSKLTDLSESHQKIFSKIQTLFISSFTKNPKNMSTIQSIPCQSCLDCTSNHLEVFKGVQRRLQTKISQKYALVTPQNLPYHQHMNLLDEIARLEKQFDNNETVSPEINVSLCSRHRPRDQFIPKMPPTMATFQFETTDLFYL